MSQPAELSKKPIVFLMGPTASGKTDLAMALSDRQPCHLISVDSALVYRGMDIGSAKPDAATLARYPHALVDIRDPAQPYSASDFVADARAEIEFAHARDRVPLLVGGTMLYFKALLEGLDDLPPADPAIRARLDDRAEAEGWPALHAELAEIDPVTAARLHPNHNQRIQRALEVYELTGKPLSAIHAGQNSGSLEQRYSVRQLAIMPRSRQTLHDRIERRLQQMFAQGLVDEVGTLYRRGDLHAELPSIRAVGYRQLWSYFSGEFELEEARYRALVATRNLAKRQLTWLRGWQGLNLLYTDSEQGRKLETTELVAKALNLLDL